jgi:AcrR family transcriptional regulator
MGVNNQRINLGSGMQAHDLHGNESEGRQRIIAAAYPLFVEHGYQAVSMQQIADAAQIHKATLYHHFQHKEDLFGSVAVAAILQSRQDVADGISQGGSPEEQFVQVAMRLFARTQSEFGRLMTDVHDNVSVERRKRIFEQQSMPWELFEQIIHEAIARKDLPPMDASFAVSIFVGMVWGQIWMRKMGWLDGPLDEQLGTRLIRIMFAGLETGLIPDAVEVPPPPSS